MLNAAIRRKVWPLVEKRWEMDNPLDKRGKLWYISIGNL